VRYRLADSRQTTRLSSRSVFRLDIAPLLPRRASLARERRC
jgi:hypothetical protein